MSGDDLDDVMRPHGPRRDWAVDTILREEFNWQEQDLDSVNRLTPGRSRTSQWNKK